MKKMQNSIETVNLNDRINEAIQKNRKPIFITLGVIAVLLAGTVTALSLMDVFRKKAIGEAEELNRRYEALRFTITEESVAGDVTALLADLEAFAKKTSGYAGGRAWSIAGSIHADKEEWAEAEAAWQSAAKAGAKTYLAPLALFNAAAAAEKQGKNQEAIDMYTQSLASPAAFPAAPHAQFSIGRLREGLNEKDAAIEAYRAVAAKWPNDPIWVKLAQSRIIAIEADLGQGNQ
jgi:tetratricopeptide (TPR) repeat protein